MRSKTLTYIIHNWKKKGKRQNTNLDKNRIKVEIENYCEQYLDLTNDILEFEVKEDDLDYVLTIVETEQISRYDIFQIDRTLFGAKLKEVDLI